MILQLNLINQNLHLGLVIQCNVSEMGLWSFYIN